MERKSIYDELAEEILGTEKFKGSYEELLKSQHIATKQENNCTRPVFLGLSGEEATLPYFLS